MLVFLFLFWSLVFTANCIVFTDFEQNLSLRLILIVFLKFRKFQSRYSHKKTCYIKNKECTRLYTAVVRVS